MNNTVNVRYGSSEVEIQSRIRQELSTILDRVEKVNKRYSQRQESTIKGQTYYWSLPPNANVDTEIQAIRTEYGLEEK